MFLKIADDGSLSLEEVDDFKKFHISGQPGGAAAFAALADDAGEGHYWLNADAIVALSGKAGDGAWCQAFWTMLEKAEPYGYSDVEGRRIKAHVA
jgi:hypothetical protein